MVKNVKSFEELNMELLNIHNELERMDRNRKREVSDLTVCVELQKHEIAELRHELNTLKKGIAKKKQGLCTILNEFQNDMNDMAEIRDKKEISE